MLHKVYEKKINRGAVSSSRDLCVNICAALDHGGFRTDDSVGEETQEVVTDAIAAHAEMLDAQVEVKRVADADDAAAAPRTVLRHRRNLDAEEALK